MKLAIYQVDAFADHVFEGNPAAVCPLEEFPEDSILQSIAAENNLSETAFIVRTDDGYDLRWFTPTQEVDLCGHATLASAHVIFTHFDYRESEIRFHSRSGALIVTRGERGYRMDFPATPPKATDAPADLIDGLGKEPREILLALDHVAVYDSEEEIRALNPDFRKLRSVGPRGVLATAPGEEVDFVSRCFFPAVGIDEDPVTGSAHCALAPYWSGKLGLQVLRARQISRRGGNVHCEVSGDRVFLSGNAVDYLKGEITV